MKNDKPCPFCGSVKLEDQHDDGIHWVKCRLCGATGPTTTKYSGEDGDDYVHWYSRTDIAIYNRGFYAGVEVAIELIQTVEEQEQYRLRNILMQSLVDARPIIPEDLK